MRISDWSSDVCSSDLPARGFRLWEEAAAAGVAMAANNLGEHHAVGAGLPKDQAKAMGWFEKAAELGLAAAMYKVGWYHASNAALTGLDDRKAVHWYRRAADAGDAEGMRRLGSAYQYGKGGAKDKTGRGAGRER